MTREPAQAAPESCSRTVVLTVVFLCVARCALRLPFRRVAPKGVLRPALCNARATHGRPWVNRSSPQKQINVTSKSPVGDISVVTLIRTDTTLVHCQRAEKECSKYARETNGRVQVTKPPFSARIPAGNVAVASVPRGRIARVARGACPLETPTRKDHWKQQTQKKTGGALLIRHRGHCEPLWAVVPPLLVVLSSACSVARASAAAPGIRAREKVADGRLTVRANS